MKGTKLYYIITWKVRGDPDGPRYRSVKVYGSKSGAYLDLVYYQSLGRTVEVARWPFQDLRAVLLTEGNVGLPYMEGRPLSDLDGPARNLGFPKGMTGEQRADLRRAQYGLLGIPEPKSCLPVMDSGEPPIRGVGRRHTILRMERTNRRPRLSR